MRSRAAYSPGIPGQAHSRTGAHGPHSRAALSHLAHLVYECTMPPRTTGPKDIKVYLSLMTKWPRVWASEPEDIPVGEGLVSLLEGFIRDLHAKGRAHKTIRRHLDNAWSIGGEIIRGFFVAPEERRLCARELLLAATDGEAPLIRNATQAEQESADATARRIHAYLLKTAKRT